MTKITREAELENKERVYNLPYDESAHRTEEITQKQITILAFYPKASFPRAIEKRANKTEASWSYVILKSGTTDWT